MSSPDSKHRWSGPPSSIQPAGDAFRRGRPCRVVPVIQGARFQPVSPADAGGCVCKPPWDGAVPAGGRGTRCRTVGGPGSRAWPLWPRVEA